MKIIAQPDEDPSTCSRGAAATLAPSASEHAASPGGGQSSWNYMAPCRLGTTVVGMMSSGLVSSLHGEDRVVS